MYVIHATFRAKKYDETKKEEVWVKRTIPAAWIFMARRRKRDYKEVLKALIDECKEHGLTFNPKEVMIDFEMAAKKAYEELLEGIIVKGCLFHYGQSLFRKFVLIGFKTEYLENPLLQVWFKSVVCLALIPINTVETQFQNLKYQIKFEIFANEPTKIAKSEQFISYFERTYLGAARDSVQKAAISQILCGIILTTMMIELITTLKVITTK